MMARILLVEDEGLIRLCAAEVLRDAGYDVVEAWNGDEAIRLLETDAPFHALLTDVLMPGRSDGFDVAARAREIDPDLPVVVVSGFAHNLQPRLDRLGPPLTFLGKPYSFSGLREKLGRLIQAT